MFSGGVLQIEQCATLDPSDVVTACYVQLLLGVEMKLTNEQVEHERGKFEQIYAPHVQPEWCPKMQRYKFGNYDLNDDQIYKLNMRFDAWLSALENIK